MNNIEHAGAAEGRSIQRPNPFPSHWTVRCGPPPADITARELWIGRNAAEDKRGYGGTREARRAHERARSQAAAEMRQEIAQIERSATKSPANIARTATPQRRLTGRDAQALINARRTPKV